MVYVARSSNSNATWTLIAVNVIIFIFTMSLQASSPIEFRRLIFSFGAIPIYVLAWVEPWRLVTSMFLHAGLEHLLLNMFALFIFGPEIEMVLGKPRFLLLYFLSGVMADIVHSYFILMFFPFPTLLTTPAIGSSGAIFGVMAAYALLFPRRTLVVFPLMIPAPAILVITFIILAQVFLAFLTPFSEVAFAAHVGGFITGLILTLIYKPSIRRLPIGY